MKRIKNVFVIIMLLSAFISLGIYAEAKVETPITICSISDLYSVDYEFDVSGEIEEVRCDVDGGMFTSNYKKDENKLYISFASSSPVKLGRIATVISNKEVVLTPVLVRLNGWLTETACIYHAEIPMDEKAPTCDTNGSHGGMKCARCGYVITEPTVLPATGPSVEATLSDDNTLTISGAVSDNVTAEGAVLVGIYADKKFMKLCDISTQNQNSINLKLENMDGADTVKIFRWESLSNLKPTHNDVTVEVSRYSNLRFVHI